MNLILNKIIKNEGEKKELKNLERNVVLMRRLEYSNKIKEDNLKKRYNNKIGYIIFIQIYQGIITDNTEIEPLKEIMNIVLEHRDNSSDFCKIIKKHLKKEDTPLPLKSRIFHIIDLLFKSDVAEYYIKHLSKYLYVTIKE